MRVTIKRMLLPQTHIHTHARTHTSQHILWILRLVVKYYNKHHPESSLRTAHTYVYYFSKSRKQRDVLSAAGGGSGYPTLMVRSLALLLLF